jgi:hypothetical protein
MLHVYEIWSQPAQLSTNRGTRRTCQRLAARAARLGRPRGARLTHGYYMLQKRRDVSPAPPYYPNRPAT